MLNGLNKSELKLDPNNGLKFANIPSQNHPTKFANDLCQNTNVLDEVPIQSVKLLLLQNPKIQCKIKI